MFLATHFKDAANTTNATNLHIVDASPSTDPEKFPVTALVDGKTETDQFAPGFKHCYISHEDFKMGPVKPFVKLGFDEMKVAKVRILMRKLKADWDLEKNIKRGQFKVQVSG